MKINIIKSISLLAASSLLLSCIGQSSDPLGKYDDLKNFAKPTSEQSEKQKEAPPVFTSVTLPEPEELTNLKLNGINDVNLANFVEGKEGIFYLKILPTSQKILQQIVEIADFPIASRPTLIALDKANIYGLKWTPPMGLIPPGKNYVKLQLKLQTTVIKASDANLEGLMKSEAITLEVNRDSSLPKILGFSNLGAGVEEGQTLPFTIDIEDPASAMSPKFPEMEITHYIYSNTEAFRADGARYVTMDYTKTVNPEKITGSQVQWRFYFLLQVDQLPLDRDRRGIENPLAPSVDVCFHIRASSVLETKSYKQQVCLKGRYAAQLPVLKWENDAIKEINAGVPTVLKFTVQSGNGLGQVSIKEATKQIAGLSGTKSIVCLPPNADILSTQNCELTWTPACLKTQTAKKLTLKVDNVVGTKKKSQVFTKDFFIVPTEENCPPVKKFPVKPTKKITNQAINPAAENSTASKNGVAR